MSLMALGQEYEDYASTLAGQAPGNVKLYIRELRTGSVIADLEPILEQVSFIIEHRELFAGFMANFNDLVAFFLPELELRRTPPTRRQAERVGQIFEPVAKDGGSQLILQVQGDVHFHAAQELNYTSQQANAIQNKVRRFLGPSLPRTITFHEEPLYLVQVRDDPKGQVGDRGVVEKFSDKPVRLRFMNEEAKQRVLDALLPFKRVFLVDGEVGTAGDTPAVYKIHYVHESFERTDA